MRTLYILLFASMMLPLNSTAQTLASVETNINHYLSIADTFQEGNSDSINHELLVYMASALEKQPATLSYDFKGLSKMRIVSSDNKKFRIYSWVSGPCGGACSENVIIQYQSANGVKVKVENDVFDVHRTQEGVVCSGGSYYQIVTMRTKSKNTIYLALSSMQCAAGLSSTTISGFVIGPDGLNDSVGIFKTKKELLNSISYEYDASINNGKLLPEFKFSNGNNMLYVPLMNGYGQFNSKYISYKFDGTYYVFEK
jgi:hypothetical protein